MVNVNFKNQYGHYTYTDRDGNKFKISMCEANCLWADMHFYKEDDGTKMSQFMGFWDDVNHMKRFFKNSKDCLKGSDNFVFHADKIKGEKRIWEAIKVLATNGKKVTIK